MPMRCRETNHFSTKEGLRLDKKERNVERRPCRWCAKFVGWKNVTVIALNGRLHATLKPAQSFRNLSLFITLILRHPLFSLHLFLSPRQQTYNHGQLHFHVAQRHHLLGHHDQCLAADPPHLCPHGRTSPGQTGRCPRRRSRQQRTKPLTSSRTRQPEKAGLGQNKLVPRLEGEDTPVRRGAKSKRATSLLSAGRPLLLSLFPEQPWKAGSDRTSSPQKQQPNILTVTYHTIKNFFSH